MEFRPFQVVKKPTKRRQVEADAEEEVARFQRLGFLAHYQGSLKHLLEMLRRLAVATTEDRQRRGRHVFALERCLASILSSVFAWNGENFYIVVPPNTQELEEAIDHTWSPSAIPPQKDAPSIRQP